MVGKWCGTNRVAGPNFRLARFRIGLALFLAFGQAGVSAGASWGASVKPTGAAVTASATYDPASDVLLDGTHDPLHRRAGLVERRLHRARASTSR